MRIRYLVAVFAAPILLLLIAFSAQAKTDLIYAGGMMTEEPDNPSRHPPAAVPQIGPGAVIPVTTTDPAANPGDTFCSLIEALENANADSDTSGGDCPAGAGPDTIELGVGDVYTLTAVYSTTAAGPNGLPAVTSAIALNGNGSTIVRSTAGATPEFRILFINGGGNLTLNETTVSNGLIDSFTGGGILNQDGTLTLNNSAVRDNEVLNASGGGIASRAVSIDVTTTINASDILSNTAGISGGGLYIVGGSNITATLVVSISLVSFNHAVQDAGGIRSTRFSGSTNNVIQVNVLGSEVSHNIATGYPGGGGLVINYTEMLMADSDVSSNRAETNNVYIGGGVVSAFSNIVILRSTIRDNLVSSAGGSFPAGGGGIFTTDGTMMIVNSTIGGNQATGLASGGALMANNHFGNSPSVVTLINSTISDNSSTISAGAVQALDSGSGQPLVINFSNTIVSNNSAPDSPNCLASPAATITSTGNNLEDLNTCNFDQPTDKINTNPLLGPLQDNGGPTWTYALLDGSPAIDAADFGVCAAPPVNGVDQRGVARPFGLSCDIGAFELEFVDFKILLPIILK
jgi:hypothetical protein